VRKEEKKLKFVATGNSPKRGKKTSKEKKREKRIKVD